MNKRVIIFRTCEKAPIHSTRPFGIEKPLLCKICFASIVAPLEREKIAHEIYVVADEMGDELAGFYAKKSTRIAGFINKKFGNDNSLRECLGIAAGFSGDDIVYFVEDDYLHHPEWPQVFPFLESCCDNVVVFPPDYLDQYRREDLMIDAKIVLGPSRHFRRVSSTTFTYLTKARVISLYHAHMLRACTGADDGLLSQLYRVLPCFSPLPGLSTHMHEGVMSPFVDWQSIAEGIKEKL